MNSFQMAQTNRLAYMVLKHTPAKTWGEAFGTAVRLFRWRDVAEPLAGHFERLARHYSSLDEGRACHFAGIAGTARTSTSFAAFTRRPRVEASTKIEALNFVFNNTTPRLKEIR